MKNGIRIIALVATAAFFATSFFSRSVAEYGGSAPVPPFSHTSSAHKKLTCAQCHTVPGRNWQKYSKYPDVGTFPYHDSCERCHGKDPKNPINPHNPAQTGAYCATCHTNPLPKMKPFPVPTRQHQFTTIFPHNVHQDLIAQVPGSEGGTAVAHFVNARYNPMADDKVPEFNNCAICHKSFAADAKLIFGPRKPLTTVDAKAEPGAETYEKDDAGKEMRPTAAYFKDSPNSHASCFSCHFQAVKPMATDCAGCHRSAAPYTEAPGITRYSIKFDHLQKDHAGTDCTSCHIRITRTADLKDMAGADVPILACRRCHATEEDARTRRILELEIGAREKSIAEKKPVFQCSYCHTAAIGRFDIPQSHR